MNGGGPVMKSVSLEVSYRREIIVVPKPCKVFNFETDIVNATRNKCQRVLFVRLDGSSWFLEVYTV
jgi:hypothetical protein